MRYFHFFIFFSVFPYFKNYSSYILYFQQAIIIFAVSAHMNIGSTLINVKIVRFNSSQFMLDLFN